MKKIILIVCAIVFTSCTFRGGNTPEIIVEDSGVYQGNGTVRCNSGHCYGIEDLFSNERWSLFESYLLEQDDLSFYYRHRGDHVTVYSIKGEEGYHGIVGIVQPEEIIEEIKYHDGFAIMIVVIIGLWLLAIFWYFFCGKGLPSWLTDDIF